MARNVKWTFWRWGAGLAGGAALLAAGELALRVRYRRRVRSGGAPVTGAATLVALGDSIVAGWPHATAEAWPARLAKHLAEADSDRAWRVHNAGVPGDTAPLGLARFEQDVAAAHPAVILIAFGLNDCVPARYGMDRWREAGLPAGLERSFLWQAARVRVARIGRAVGWPAPRPETTIQPRPRTSPAGFAVALRALLDRAALLGARPVLLTMTPLANTSAEGVRNRGASYTAYNHIIREVAACNRVALVDLTVGAPPGMWLADGFHLTVAGQAWVAAQVFAQLAAPGMWRAPLGGGSR